MRLLCFILLLSSTALFGQGPGFMATVTKSTVGVSETFKLELTLTNTEGSIVLPAIQDFSIVQGPFTSNQTSIVNGHMTQKISNTYVLRPKRIGKFTIPPCSARTKSGLLKSEAVAITVVKGSAASVAASGTGEFYTTVSVTKRKAFIGEPIVATYRLFMRFNNLSDTRDSYPDLDGFWTETIESSDDWEIEVINGMQYKTIVVKRDLLFPQRSGELTIGSFELSGVVSNSSMDRMFGRGKEVIGRSKPVTITVEPLPKAEPANYLGTYKDLKIDVDVSKTQLAANEAINMNIKFTGKGNLKLLGAPNLTIPGDFESYDPKLKDNIRINSGGESGSRTFEYIFIPRSPGLFEIPSLTLSYFDPDDEKFKTLVTTAQTFEVSRGNDDSNVAYTFDSKTDVNVLNQDIRYIRPTTTLRAPSAVFFGSMGFFGIMALPLIILGLAIGWRKRNESALVNESFNKQKKAGKMARKHLAQARKLCDTGASKEYFLSVHAAILGYLADKFSLPQSDLNTEKIQSLLSQSAGSNSANETLQILELCERARYAPVNDVSESELLQKTEDLIEKIEKETKK